MKQIVLKFSVKTGDVKVEAQGFKGSGCEQATQFLKNSLGKMTDFERKAEWYEVNLNLNGEIDSNLCG